MIFPIDILYNLVEEYEIYRMQFSKIDTQSGYFFNALFAWVSLKFIPYNY